MLDLLHGDISVTSANRKSAAITGSARKIKDNAADWHNMMLRWDRLNEDGFMAVASIINMRRAQSDQLVLNNSSSPPPSSSPQHVGGASELQDKCLKLQEIVDKMAAVVTKMARLMTSQRGVEDLEAFQFGAEGRKTPLFHSWSTSEFGEISQVLLDSFRQELLLKQTILQEVAHTLTSDLCMVFLSCWLHQPFIPTQSRLRLEALLLETGHRPL
ncbi:cyclin-dependent kinase 2-interacting protein isoform X1 [Simochromis diagramma]|uniref:cyclin-dependent kinase 2-interacting protein isoform X1 n=2 Tax=Simochromis diagramma TaxID=43689 RepID=UPI001A7EB10F|nr:cyclin-dependent kinase 2-interacting protein isoform X1 [Simochromis diagramma]